MAIISLILAVSLMFSPITQALTSFYEDAYTPGAKQIESVSKLYEDGEEVGTVTIDFKVSKDIKDWDYKTDSAELNVKMDYIYTEYEPKCVETAIFEGREVCVDTTYEEIKVPETKEAHFAIKDGGIYVSKGVLSEEFIDSSYNKNPEVSKKVVELLNEEFPEEYLLVSTFESLEQELKEEAELETLENELKDNDFTNLETIAKDFVENLKTSINKTGIENTFIKYKKNQLDIEFTPETIINATHKVINYYHNNFYVLENIIDDYGTKLYEDEAVQEMLKLTFVSATPVEQVCEESVDGNYNCYEIESAPKTEEEIAAEMKTAYFETIAEIKTGLKETIDEAYEGLNVKKRVCEEVVLYEYETEDGKIEKVTSKECKYTKEDLIKAFGDSKFTLNAKKENNGDIKIISDIKLSDDYYLPTENEEITNEDFFYIEIKSETTIKNIDEFDLTFTASKTTEDYEKALEKQYNKLDPYKIINISWYDYYEDEANYSSVRSSRNITEDEFYMDYDYETKQFYIIDGRIYLPMRYIAESFGETVEWDGQARKAYVVRGNEKIDMSGIIYDGTTYIKIRDFEKLGYTVSYEEDEWGEKIATVVKN